MTPVEVANKLFGIKQIRIAEKVYEYVERFKIVVFVPASHVDKLTFSMASAGAGKIGNYTACSFRIKGIGIFKGGAGTNPFAGTKQKFEMVEEIRLEMICDNESLNRTIDSMLANHPYEKAAYEIYPVLVRDKQIKNSSMFRFKKDVTLSSILKKLNPKLSPSMKLSVTNVKRKKILITIGRNYNQRLETNCFHIIKEKKYYSISIT